MNLHFIVQIFDRSFFHSIFFLFIWRSITSTDIIFFCICAVIGLKLRITFTFLINMPFAKIFQKTFSFILFKICDPCVFFRIISLLNSFQFLSWKLLSSHHAFYCCYWNKRKKREKKICKKCQKLPRMLYSPWEFRRIELKMNTSFLSAQKYLIR